MWVCVEEVVRACGGGYVCLLLGNLQVQRAKDVKVTRGGDNLRKCIYT